ncbi:MAG: hypothetical protein LBV79_07270, partial [Candidatus Adiutrix sp.]|nr:hypothetical protein [Candidatus Adiutrix sp.]
MLERGRLTARPGLDRYVYAFPAPVSGAPAPGCRGWFRSGPHAFPARIIDRRGPVLSLSLAADKPLGSALSGSFAPNPPPEELAVNLDDSLTRPAGAALFLDPQEGWVMSAAEAAGHSGSAFEARFWPQVAGDEVAQKLSPTGLTFVWSPQPEKTPAAVVALAGHFRQKFATVLILADAPAELGPLAGLCGENAVFLGEAAPDTPLHSLSMYTKAERAREAREREQADLRNQLALLKRDEAGVKARLTLWEDLEALERRFADLGREVARFRNEWERVRRETAEAGTAWEEARTALDNSGQGLLGWLRKGGPDPKAARREEQARQAVDSAETAMRTVRREEENALEEAARLEQRLRQARQDSEKWLGRAELATELADLRGRQETAEAQLRAALSLAPLSPEKFAEGAGVVLALTADVQSGEILAGKRFPAVLALTGHPPDHDGRRRLAALVGSAEEHLVIFGDFTFWPIWSGRAPMLPDSDTPAWSSLMLAGEEDVFKLFLAEGGLFTPQALPAGGPALSALPSGRGLGLRALGEIGPANPVSALGAARAAAKFAASYKGDGPAVIVLTASAAQAGLIERLLLDLKAPAGKIFCGQPQDFIHWPPVPLVILEPAFEAPHLSHPWAWP